MAIYIDQDEPAVCQNEKCEWFKSFELYPIEEVKKDKDGNYFIECYKCKQKIYLD